MKSIIWKYHARVDDPDLKDEMGRAGCRVLNPDPDFWENDFPVWTICGPYVRARLDKGDVLFFTPTRERCRRAGVEEYICTGYLFVEELLRGSRQLLKDSRFTQRYKRNYKVDLQRHLDDDGEVTRKQRPLNGVIGDRCASRWFGRKGVALSAAIKKARIRDVDLRDRLVRDLTGDEVRALLETLDV